MSGDQRDSAMVKALVLHATDMDYMPGTTYYPPSMTGVNSVHKARINPCIFHNPPHKRKSNFCRFDSKTKNEIKARAVVQATKRLPCVL